MIRGRDREVGGRATDPTAEAASLERCGTALLLAVVVGADGALDVAGKLDERAGNATGHFLFLANASDVIDVLGKVIDFDGAAELLGAAGEEGAVSGRISEGADIGIGEDAISLCGALFLRRLAIELACNAVYCLLG